MLDLWVCYSSPDARTKRWLEKRGEQEMDRDNYWIRRRGLSRRAMLRASAVAGIGAAAYVVTGCGDDDDENGGTTAGGTKAPETAAASATAEPKAGGVLKLAGVLEPTTLFPVINGNWGSQLALNVPIYDRLFEYDSSLAIVPGEGLVEKFEHPDALTYIFTLHPNITFHDDTPLNAPAVKKHLETVQTHPSSVGKGEVAAIAKMETPSDLVIKLTLSRGQGDYPLTLAGRAGAIVSPTAVEKHGTDIGRNPSGAGPFKLQEWAVGSHWTLVKNPNYWKKGLPYVDRVEYKVMTDEQVVGQGLRSGEIDAESSLAALVTQFAALKATKDLTVLERPGFQFGMFYMNGSKPPFDNPLLAQAVAYAIDREEVVQAAYFGHGWPAQGFIPQGNKFFDDSFNPYGTKADIPKAKAKLAEAGMPDGFEFTIDTYSGFGYFSRLAPAIKEMLGKAGITANIRLGDTATTTQRIFSLDMDAVLSYWAGRANLFETVTSLYHSSGGFNSGAKRVKNPQFDPLVEKAGNSTSEEESREVFQELQRVVAEDARNVALEAGHVLGYHQKSVHGYELIGDAGARLTRVWKG